MQNMGTTSCLEMEDIENPKPGDCLTPGQVQSLFAAINAAVDRANTLYPQPNMTLPPDQLEQDPNYIKPLDYNEFAQTHCLSGAIFEVCENKLKEIIDRKKAPKAMFQLDETSLWPWPTTQELQKTYDECNGWWMLLSDIYGCTHSSSPSGCIDYLDFRALYKAAECIATRNCRPKDEYCKSCPICADQCWCPPCEGCYLIIHHVAINDSPCGSLYAIENLNISRLDCACDLESNNVLPLRTEDEQLVPISLTANWYYYANVIIYRPVVKDDNNRILTNVPWFEFVSPEEPHYINDICKGLKSDVGDSCHGPALRFKIDLFYGRSVVGQVYSVVYMNQPVCDRPYHPAFPDRILVVMPENSEQQIVELTRNTAEGIWVSNITTPFIPGCTFHKLYKMDLTFDDITGKYMLTLYGVDGLGQINSLLCGSPLYASEYGCATPNNLTFEGGFATM